MIVCLFNQALGSNLGSGGDVLSVEICRRIETEKIFVGPANFKSTLAKYISPLTYVTTEGQNGLTTASSVWGGIRTVRSYVVRAFSCYWQLNKKIQQPCTIYLTGDFICNVLPAWLLHKRKRDIRVVGNFFHRNPMPAARPNNPYLVSLGSRLLQTLSLTLMKQMTDVVFVLSEIGKKELVKEGFNPSSIVVSGAGINLKEPRLDHQSKPENQLIFIGRLNVTKGAFDLMHILAKLKTLSPQFRCKMVGHGSERDINLLKDLIERYSLLNEVELVGFVSEQEKQSLLENSTMLVFPSKEEGYGIVVQEALAVGLSVVCFELPALREVFGGFSAVSFVPVGDFDGFAEAVHRRLLDKKQRGAASTRTASPMKTWDDVYRSQSGFFYA